jgi:acyl-CoA synthetase (NDP forming)
MARVPTEFFSPRSVAIVGASGDPSKLGYRPLENLRRVGYAGTIYPINPRGGEIGGLKCYREVKDLPETPDIAILLLPGQAAIEAAEQCASLGVRAAIVASSGFAEAGEEGRKLQDALSEVARRGLRMLGPNTNGIYSANDGFSLGYSNAHSEIAGPGAISVVSHSGALFTVVAERMKREGLRLNKYVPVGNEADLDMLDFAEYLADDDSTRVVLLLVEALKDGERFRAVAQKLRSAGKPTAVLKLGTSAAGLASTAAHSSRLAGNMRAYTALLDAAGVGRVDTLEGLIAFARLATRCPEGWSRQVERGLGIVTASGAGGTLVVDAAARYDFAAANFEQATERQLAAFHESATSFNPMDVGNFGGTVNMKSTAPLVSLDANVDAVISFAYTLQTPVRRADFTHGIVAGAQRSGKPHLVLAPGGLPADQVEAMESGGIPVFTESASMMEGFNAYCLSKRPAAAPVSEPVPFSMQLPPDALVKNGTLSELESLRLLDLAGIATMPRRVVSSEAEALEAADALGWPVVLKGGLEGVAHKSDSGLVHLNLGTPSEVKAAYQALRAVTSAICVQKMIRAEVELLVGMTTEPPLGRFLVAGLGGRYAEQLDDVHLWSMPVMRARLREDLANQTSGRILQGPRWGAAGTLDDLVDVLLRIQAFAMAAGPALMALEVNPLGAGAGGLIALDALAVVA